MLKNTLINRKATVKVARALGELNRQVVFVGGAMVSLYIDDPTAEDIRPTKDIDLTFQIATVSQLEELRQALTNKGFHETHDSTVICRFSFEDLLVDVMSTQAVGWAPGNRWFASGFDQAIKVQLENSVLLQELEDYHTLAQEDIDQAFEVQKSLLPSPDFIQDLENRHGIKIDSLFVPSRFLSGDVWGILDIGPTQLAIWICDFSGKGIRAALHTFRLHTLIQEFKHCADDPGEIIDALNSRLIRFMPSGQFSTFLVGVIDFKTDTFTYTSASATHPLVYFPKDKKFEVGDGTGVPLGVIDRQSYPLRTMPFPKESSLVLYSDLLWEFKAVPGVFLDVSNLDNFAKELNGQGLIKTVRQQVSLLGEPSFSDDLTLIEVTRLSQGKAIHEPKL